MPTVKDDDITESLRSFTYDTAPGISGWTVGLLRLAMKSPTVVTAITKLANLIGAGNAPGRDMLCSARLTPLGKRTGGVRPIAAGELMYRLAAKALLSKSFDKTFSLPYQLGVQSPGGVDTVAHTIQQAMV
jgi:hypothetical protein